MAEDEFVKDSEKSGMIVFDIPSLTDKKTNLPFKKTVTLTSRKAYSVFKRLAKLENAKIE